MKKFISKNIQFGIILSLVMSVFIESYIVLIEHAGLIVDFSLHDFINLFSLKEFTVFLLIFYLLFYIFFDKKYRDNLISFIYVNRFSLSVIVIGLAVIFQIHGSSINCMNIFNVPHKPLLGVSRPIRSDEYVVNTMFAFSQYMNDFSYFSYIVRASVTDMFIIYGQPVWDIGMIFRPFLIGYLILNPGQGLSFFWIGRLVFLFLVSFEFGMLLTNKNKSLSLIYSLLISFSPVVQWWFAVNGLVELLIFGQLCILLINWYMKTEDYKKRFLIAFGLMISIGTFLLVFYPSWQIPYGYVFILLASWIFLKNRVNFKLKNKDLFIFICLFSIFIIIMGHILINSIDTIKIILNTSYPSSQKFNGEGNIYSFLYYVPSIFFPLKQSNLLINVCNYSIFVDLFPMPLILSGIILIYQKRKDKLLMGLLILYLIFVILYLVSLPEFIVDLTFRSIIKTTRLPSVISFIGVLILIRSLSSLKELNYKFIVLMSVILSIFVVYLSIFEFSEYYLSWMVIFAVILYMIVYFLLFSASSKKNQKILLISIIIVSFFTGAFVNPIDYGTDVVYGSKYLNQVGEIVKTDSDSVWITQGMPLNILLPVGAKTVNSVNVYPDLDKWHKLDVFNQSEGIYNRYAHIYIELEYNDTSFELIQNDLFVLHLNVNDLKKLNVSYIATDNHLENLSNDNLTFYKCYEYSNYRIYHVIYNS